MSSDGPRRKPGTEPHSPGIIRKRADYWAYYWAQCAKFGPRTIDWDHDAFESVLALVMYDHPGKSETDCVIALAKMQLYAPYTGRRA